MRLVHLGEEFGNSQAKPRLIPRVREQARERERDNEREKEGERDFRCVHLQAVWKLDNSLSEYHFPVFISLLHSACVRDKSVLHKYIPYLRDGFGMI